MANKRQKSTHTNVTIPDVALVFDVTRQAVHKWTKENGKPFTTFTPEDVERLIEERQAEVDKIRARWALLQTMLENGESE